MYANCHRVCERYSRRTSVLINRLLYNDSSREQHNNEIYAGEIYGGNNSEKREERVGEEKKKMADMFLNSTRGIKMPPLRIFTFCSLLARFPFPFFEAETRG